MNLLLLTAIIAAVTSTPLSQIDQNWPWQVGKVYSYDVNSHTLNNYEEGISRGSAFKAQFTVSVKAPGHLIAKLENSLYAPVTDHIHNNYELLTRLNYQKLKVMDQNFEFFVNGGRIISMNVPSKLPISYTNFLKGLVSALQVDISTYGRVHNYPNSFDKNTFQGLFKKMETDVTGECETLYSVSPMAAEWHRELPNFTSEEDPIEIVKSRDYGICNKRANIYVGIPEGAVFQGTAQTSEEKQMIKHTFEGRLLVGKQGPIYKASALSTVVASPLLFGKQKAEVFSYVQFNLNTVEQVNSDSQQKPGEFRTINSLLYTNDNSAIFTQDVQEAIAKHLLQETGPMLLNPNDIPIEKFLLKFNFLVDILASCNSKQLTEINDSIDISTSSKVARNRLWTIYRDAVAVTGTKEAYEHIKSWVLNKKVEGNEAAEVISVMGGSLSNPSVDLLKDFFNFSIDPVVVELKHINNSALLASSKLLRSIKNDPFIDETVIPYFDKELKRAIKNGDTNKARVYVKVLGNLAHPSIIKVFAPYLEGRIPVTKYLRTQIVTDLKTLASQKNEYIRAVLYSILRNTGENYEVRVAAALNIFTAVPTAEMMQVLAHMTHFDPSTQVRAVLTSSITTAANLKDPRFTELAKTAQSVLNLITKETFDTTYSTNIVDDGYISEDDYNYFNHLTSIGSDNSFIPKYIRNAFSLKGTGLNEESEVTLSLSDVQGFLNYFGKTISEPTKIDPKFKFSAKRVVEMLNIKRAPREPLEGALFIDDTYLQKLVTFNENDFGAFFANAENYMRNLLDGTDAQYTKILYLKNIRVTFPLASGMPYLFEYKEPALVMAKAHVVVQVDTESKSISGSLKTEIDLTYSRDVQGSVSFLDIFGDQYAISGVYKTLQFYIPLKINTEYNAGTLKVQFEPLHADKDISLIQFYVIPFTRMHKRNTMRMNYKIKPFKRSAKTGSIDFKFGHSTGMLYKVEGTSFSSDYKDLEKLFNDDLLTNFGRLINQKDTALTIFTFKYLGRKSKVNSISFTAYLETLYNQKISGILGPALPTKHLEPHSLARREEITKKVSSGMESAKVQLLDFSAQFDGSEKAVFVFTGAYAYSNVDSKLQAAFFAHATEQIYGIFKLDLKKPIIQTLNFQEALKNEVKLTYMATIKYQNASFHLQGYGKRSEEYTEMLKKDPMAKLCLEDISNENYFQKNCYNMTLKSYAPDYFKAAVTFKEFDPAYLSLPYYAYNEFVKPGFDLQEERNDIEKTVGDRMEIETQLFYYDNYVNCKLTTNNGSFSLENLEITWDYPYIMSTYALSLKDSFDSLTDYENIPYCAIDDNMVSTFSGRSYDYVLSALWHVVMVYDSEDLGTDLVILARRPTAKQEEVYVSYTTEEGKYFELLIKPDVIDVKSNANKISNGSITIYWDEGEEEPLLEYYNLAEDIYVFNIQDQNIRLVYDKQRLLIFTDEYRNSTMGICGRSSTEIRDDYMTPWGLVDLPKCYGASFSLEGEFSYPKTVALKKQAKLIAYQPVTKFTSILRSDGEWSKAINGTPK